MELIRGTTPTITFTFDSIDPASIITADLTITQCGKTIVNRSQSTMTVGNTTVSWKLTQEETLAFQSGLECFAQIRYKTTDNNVYASPIGSMRVCDILKDGVL